VTIDGNNLRVIHQPLTFALTIASDTKETRGRAPRQLGFHRAYAGAGFSVRAWRSRGPIRATAPASPVFGWARVANGGTSLNKKRYVMTMTASFPRVSPEGFTPRSAFISVHRRP
jgi:hypothetical protein